MKLETIQPQYAKEGITLYLSDCESILRHMPSMSVDGVITDPPFGINFDYDGRHNDKVSSGEYGKWLWMILEECERVCKPGSPVFVWQGMPNCRHFSDWFPRDYRIFAAAKNFTQMRKGLVLQYAFDPVIIWWTPGERHMTGKGSGLARDYHIANNAKAVAETWSLSKEHPCPRPLDQLEYIIRSTIRPRGVVLDPFLGSGTTAVACWTQSRECIGIEKDPDYFRLATKRVEDIRGAGTVTEIRRQITRRVKRG